MSNSGNIPPTGPISFRNLQEVIKKQKNCTANTHPGTCCCINDIGSVMYNGRNSEFFFPERGDFDNNFCRTIKFSNFRESSVLTIDTLSAIGESYNKYKTNNDGCVWGYIDPSTVTPDDNGNKYILVNLIGSGKAVKQVNITNNSCKFYIDCLNAPNNYTLVVSDPYYLEEGSAASIRKSDIRIAYNNRSVINYGNCIQTH